GLFAQPIGNTKPMWEPSLLAMRPELTPHNGHREKANNNKENGVLKQPMGRVNNQLPFLFLACSRWPLCGVSSGLIASKLGSHIGFVLPMGCVNNPKPCGSELARDGRYAV
ncbi:MAG: hypothetical protein ABWY28_06110, partial [Pseudomonas prosekii]